MSEFTPNSVLKEFCRLLSGGCFAPIRDDIPLHAALNGKTFSILFATTNDVYIFVMAGANKQYRILNSIQVQNDKSQDFKTFLAGTLKRERVRILLKMGIGCLVSFLPPDFIGETVSPDGMGIPFSQHMVLQRKTAKPATIQEKMRWLNYWLDADPAIVADKCQTSLVVSNDMAYRVMYLQPLNQFVLGGIPKSVLDVLYSVGRITPILRFKYLPFEFINMASIGGIFSPAPNGESSSAHADSGLWGIYAFNHVINIAWRRASESNTSSAFSTKIDYNLPQTNVAATRSNLDTIFRSAAAFFVKNVLYVSHTIMNDPTKFMLHCSDLDSTKKASYMEVLAASFMRPVTPYVPDLSDNARIVGGESHMSDEIQFFLSLLLSF